MRLEGLSLAMLTEPYTVSCLLNTGIDKRAAAEWMAFNVIFLLMKYGGEESSPSMLQTCSV